MASLQAVAVAACDVRVLARVACLHRGVQMSAFVELGKAGTGVFASVLVAVIRMQLPTLHRHLVRDHARGAGI